ncbi:MULTISPECIES: transposase [unclassified Exiguobacterium]|uniref:transposase n=2 Tax=Bacilli TaxID=91061 RepID=UPI001BE7A3EC|nr:MULTISPECIES: transposase [unclassified Exiguobacterium]
MDGKTEQFTKAIYETVVTESIRSYKVMFNNIEMSSDMDDFSRQIISLYQSLSDDNQKILMKLIEQTIIDDVSHIFGIIDGTSPLTNCKIEPSLLLDSEQADEFLQEMFISYIEEENLFP